MDGKILFLCDDTKCNTKGINKNIHVFSTLKNANAIEDYHTYITNGFNHNIHNFPKILREIKRGAIMIFLIPQKYSSTWATFNILPFGSLNYENIGRTEYSEIITTKRNIKKYLKMAKHSEFIFNTTVKEIYEEYEICGIRLQQNNSNLIYEFESFMIHSRSKEVFFGSISYGKGKIILLPELEFYEKEQINLLADIAMEFISVETESVVKEPEWLDDIVSKDEKQLNAKLSSLDEQKNKINEEKLKYKKLKMLLYETDKKLEKAVEYAFNILKCDAKRTEPGANVDLRINYNNLNFFAEITGITSKISKKSNKLTQLFHEVQNTDEETKPILIANTYADKEPTKRGKIDFTNDALKVIAGCNNPCCMTSYTLYQLVIDFLECKKTSDEIMNLIYDTNGVLEIKKKKLIDALKL
ncbi:MAG: hypothetical protein KAS12_03625 [Candidatus Aenigmarchaeota archaeon]|nr:hypothetical protein [Candidatus Aenigmarchaeota archaeon]